MRVSYVSLLAISSVSIASPVLSKRADAISLLTDLYATVQIYTGAITATVQVGAQINLITAAVTSTANDINALPTSPSTPTNIATTQPQEKRQIGLTVGVLLSLIIEIFATVTAAVAVLGLGGLLIFLNPLTSALSLLIVTVQLVLDVVLLDVIALLNALLTGLALGVSGM